MKGSVLITCKLQVGRLFCLKIVLLASSLFISNNSSALEGDYSNRVELKSEARGNIFNDQAGMVLLKIPEEVSCRKVLINLQDEYATNKISRELKCQHEIGIQLKEKGYYFITASVLDKQGHQTNISTSAAVLGWPLKQNFREHSPFGIWDVNGDIDLSNSAGAKWARKMWYLKDYTLDSSGNVFSQPVEKIAAISKNYPLDKRFSWIGTWAGGFPSWIEGGPVFGKKGKIYTPDEWPQLSQLIKRFSQDIDEFPEVFEVYNEPDLHWIGEGGAEELVAFHRVVGAAIKEIHPRVKIIGPSLWTVDIQKLKALIEAGLLQHVDGLSLHGYVLGGGEPEAEFIQRIDQLKKYLASIGKSDVPMYLTEFGWTTSYDEKSPRKSVNNLTQAKYVARALPLLHSQGLNVIMPFSLLYKTKGSEAGYSLINEDMSPKPGYVAFAHAAKVLAEYDRGVWLRVEPSANFVMFNHKTKLDQQLLVAWATDDGVNVYLPPIAQSAEDMMGKVLRANVSHTLTSAPIFLSGKMGLINQLNIQKPILLHRGQIETIRRGGKTSVPIGLAVFGSARIKVLPNAASGRYLVFSTKRNSLFLYVFDVL